MTRRFIALALAATLAACSHDPEPADPGSTAALTDPDHPGEELAVPSTTPPAVPDLPPPAEASGPVVDYTGFAGIPFGATPDALAAAWPGGVAPDEGADPGACHFLYAQPKPQESYGVAFMVEGGRFVRVDVDTPEVQAPGGGHAGMSLAALRAAYPNAQEQPHKYVEGGKYLVVAPAGGGEARLVFEVDPAGSVTEWRIGVPPQVHYVEGCA
jgi:hypothetical protein